MKFNNNNNSNANVYGAVIMAQPLREFTRFIWLNVAWRFPGGCRPLDQADQLEPIDPPVGSYSNYIRRRHLSHYFPHNRKVILELTVVRCLVGGLVA